MIHVRYARRTAITAACLVALTGPLTAQGLPSAAPESVGLSTERLERLDRVMREYVDQGRIAGTVALVARHGKVAHLQAYGKRDVEKNAPMQRDTIFRIASMSKAVTSIAALMLMEDGRLLLSDPVSKFIPAFKNTTVAAPRPAGAAPTAPWPSCRRSGRSRFAICSRTPPACRTATARPRRSTRRPSIWMWYFADKNEPILPIMERLASLPFDAQPGEKYVYGFNTDILGAVVESASGMPLDEFFRTRIFEPLRMVDTAFFLPPAKRDRLATVYAAKEGAGIERAPDPGTGQGDYVDGPRKCFSGGAGLLSTAARLRALPADAAERRRARRRAAAQPEDRRADDDEPRRHSLQRGQHRLRPGLRDRRARGPVGPSGSVGEFSWGGAYYTSYWADPQEQIVAVFMSQLLPSESSTCRTSSARSCTRRWWCPPTAGTEVPALQSRRHILALTWWWRSSASGICRTTPRSAAGGRACNWAS